MKREREREREKRGEEKEREREEKHQLVASPSCPDQRWNWKPRYVP